MHTGQDTSGDSGSPADTAPRGDVPALGWWMVPIVLAVVHLIVAVPLILRGTMTGRWGEDQINFHEKAIRVFAHELPKPNLRDYHSATTPGYHLIVAAASRVFGDSTATLQLIGDVFTVILLGTFGIAVAMRYRSAQSAFTTPASRRALLPPLMALCVCLPFLCSMYVFQAGVWLLPENAGWLGVLLVMVVALRFRASVGTLAAGSAALVMLVLFRQNHVWAAGLLWVGAWLSVRGPHGHSESIAELVTFPVVRAGAAGAFIASLPAFVILYMFCRMWGGLTPREFQGQYKGFNPAAPAFFLSVFGVVSVFFVGFIADGLRLLVSRKRMLLCGAALLGLIVAVVPATSLSVADGRFSGLWKIAEKLPLIAGHTAPGIAALAVLGSVMAAAWFVSLPWRERWFFLAALFGFMLAQSGSFQVYQRYSEPFVLMLLALMSASVCCMTEQREHLAGDVRGRTFVSGVIRAARVAGPVSLAIFLVLLAYVTMRNAPVAVLHDSGFLP